MGICYAKMKKPDIDSEGIRRESLETATLSTFQIQKLFSISIYRRESLISYVYILQCSTTLYSMDGSRTNLLLTSYAANGTLFYGRSGGLWLMMMMLVNHSFYYFTL